MEYRNIIGKSKTNAISCWKPIRNLSSDKIYGSMNKKGTPWQYLCSRNVINRKNWKVSRYAQNLHKRRLHYHDDLKDVVRLMSRALILQDKVSEGEYAGVFCII